MKGDFARVTFNPSRHYSQVLQQQGRVLLEADWNEQGQIQLQLLHTLVQDLVGPCWAAGDGFSLTSSSTNADGTPKALSLTDWKLAPGHFYVDGILCVNENECTLATQPQAPTPDFSGGKTGFEDAPDAFALWLDVWERHLSAVEDSTLADVALEGVDTCSRAQVVWQVRMLDVSAADSQLGDIEAAVTVRQKSAENAGDSERSAAIQQLEALRKLRAGIQYTNGDKDADGGEDAGKNDDPCALVRQLLGARGLYAQPGLRAALGPVDVDSDPCIIAADARYRGCENQLYRVEIHQGGLPKGTGGATFKWSRENGSVIFPISESEPGLAADGSAQISVTLARLGRDQRLGLAVDDWVELLDDDDALAQRAAPLLQVLAVDVAGSGVTLGVPHGITAHQPASDPGKHPLLRRWDQRKAVNAEGVVVVAESGPIALEDGIQISFQPGGVYATGDYWLIPARASGSGLLDWPLATAADGTAAGPATLAPRGRHHYAVLGVSDNEQGYRECCCRFGTLCDLLPLFREQQARLQSAPAGQLVSRTRKKRVPGKKPA